MLFKEGPRSGPYSSSLSLAVGCAGRRGSAVVLEMTGRKGVKEMIAAELGLDG